jgi:hypothetical protein
LERAKKSNPWDSMFRRISVVYQCDMVYPPKSTAAELDAAESELGFRFPASYRAFAETFGLGGILVSSLPELYVLTVPPGGDRDGVFYSVVDMTRDWEEVTWVEEGLDERIEQMISFGGDEGHFRFAFDPEDVTDARRHEYRVYSVGRGGSLQVAGDSFTDWLAWLDVHYRFDGEIAEESYPVVLKPESSDPRPLRYCPHCVRFKNAPKKSDVKRWLHWNHGAIAGLARSIREDGRTDTFPILADALEEAGCANEDLLHSCRAGDPDIDGLWALAVLLGDG